MTQLTPQTDKPSDKPNGETSETGESKTDADKAVPDEFGGPKGPEPTRYGDWEQKGRCSDF